MVDLALGSRRWGAERRGEARGGGCLTFFVAVGGTSLCLPSPPLDEVPPHFAGFCLADGFAGTTGTGGRATVGGFAGTSAAITLAKTAPTTAWPAPGRPSGQWPPDLAAPPSSGHSAEPNQPASQQPASRVSQFRCSRTPGGDVFFFSLPPLPKGHLHGKALHASPPFHPTPRYPFAGHTPKRYLSSQRGGDGHRTKAAQPGQ